MVLGVAGLAGAALFADHSPPRVIIKPSAPATTAPATAAPAPGKTKIKHRTKIVTVTPAPAQPAPAAVPPTAGRPPDAESIYAADIANAGITAPYGWLISTGNTLCADWAAGETAAQTDPILTAGGIYAYHLATFDAITNSDMCPGITP